MSSYQNKIAMVTGGASGIGYGLGKALGAAGATVIIADIDVTGAKNAAQTINDTGGQAMAVSLNVAQAEDVQAALEVVLGEYGRIDYLFNNAGIGICGEMYDTDVADWRRIVDINLLGVVYGSAVAYTIMRQQGSGHIINISSLAGLIGYPTAAPYATTKSALVGMSLSLREEAAQSGVKVSVVCPGYVQTVFFDSATLLHTKKEDILRQIPFKMMTADSAAEAILHGVRQNRAIIVFPFYARLLWWLYRIHPILLKPIASKMVKDFRKTRQASG